SSVSGAGDVNRDGHADVIVGAPGDDNNGNFSGSARVLSGKDGKILYTFDGDSKFDRFGASVSGAGDVNRDGHADLLVGAYGDDNNGAGSGSARVFSGKTLTLWSDRHEIVVKQGGTQKLTLDAGKQHANRSYWVIGSVTGTKPGFTLAGLHFPLNFPDPYMDLTLGLFNTGPWVNFRKKLDGNGRATALLNVPQYSKSFTPLTLHHAYLVYDAQGWYMVSNPVPVTLR
ncbi:MAG: hypothetical protein ACYS5W_18415, partial [Planctomycetota bacterium]